MLKLVDNSSIEKQLTISEIKNIREVFNGSNQVFLCEMLDGEDVFFSIYKPIKGEKPLRDFFSGNLCYREKAAYEISKFFLWPNLPPLVIREGPFGIGSFQKFINHDPKENYFTLYSENKSSLFFVFIFDFLILNTDRKAGSILIDDEKKIWAIDQALAFNPNTRFRTVMFEYNNQLIEGKILNKINELLEMIENKEEIFKNLSNCISEDEIDSLKKRCKTLLKHKKLPKLDPYYNVPYPLI
tara:strand:- start:15175 stop:15900 length:726 start_codon:yes stop_codon:yes gene_type:complete